MTYVPPELVISPKQHWTLVSVLDPGGENSTTLAIGRWDNELRLGMRWNGNANNPVGNPQSRGLPTWFILESKYYEAIIESGTLPEESVKMARMFFPAPKRSDRNDPSLMGFYRHEAQMKAILKDLVSVGGQKQYNPNHDGILLGHLTTLLTIHLIKQVDGADPVTYTITERGRELAG